MPYPEFREQEREATDVQTQEKEKEKQGRIFNLLSPLSVLPKKLTFEKEMLLILSFR